MNRLAAVFALLLAQLSFDAGACDDVTPTAQLTQSERDRIAANITMINVLLIIDEKHQLFPHLREENAQFASHILEQFERLNLQRLDNGEAINLTLRFGVAVFSASARASAPRWVIGKTQSRGDPPIPMKGIPHKLAESALWHALDNAIANRVFERGALNRVYVIPFKLPSVASPAELPAKARSRFVSVHFLIPSEPDGEATGGYTTRDLESKLAGFAGNAGAVPMTRNGVLGAITADLLARAKGIPVELQLVQAAIGDRYTNSRDKEVSK